MIALLLNTNESLVQYPEAIQTALNYLLTNDFTKMEPGVYDIQGQEIYAQVFDVETKIMAEARPEVHRKFVDVQYLVSGEERLGFAKDTGNYEIDECIDERDLIFYKEEIENEGFIESIPGCCCMFFPEDVHRPGVSVNEPMMVRKVVVKVSVDLI